MAKNVQINDQGVIKITTKEGKILWGNIKAIQGNDLVYRNINQPKEFTPSPELEFELDNPTVQSNQLGDGAKLIITKDIAPKLRLKYPERVMSVRGTLPSASKFAAATKDAAAASPAAPPKPSDYTTLPPLTSAAASTSTATGSVNTPPRSTTPSPPPSPHYETIPASSTSSTLASTDASGDKSGGKSGAGAPALTPSAAAAPVLTSASSSAPPSPASAAVPPSVPKQLTPIELANRAKASGVSGVPTTAVPVVSPAPTSASSARFSFDHLKNVVRDTIVMQLKEK